MYGLGTAKPDIGSFRPNQGNRGTILLGRSAISMILVGFSEN